MFSLTRLALCLALMVCRLNKELFFQNALGANPKMEIAMPMPSLEIVIWKRALHIYICEKLFTKTESLNFALALQAHFLEWRLTHFGKELFQILPMAVIQYGYMPWKTVCVQCVQTSISLVTVVILLRRRGWMFLHPCNI